MFGKSPPGEGKLNLMRPVNSCPAPAVDSMVPTIQTTAGTAPSKREAMERAEPSQ